MPRACMPRAPMRARAHAKEAPVEREQVYALGMGLLVQQRLHVAHQALRRRATRAR